MNTTKGFFYTFIILFALNSCIKDDGNHLLQMEYPVPYKVLYADQTTDSIVFSTFDSYNINLHNNWVSLVGSDTIDFDYNSTKLYSFIHHLNFETNTTGHTRSTVVGVKSYSYQTGARFYQVGYLNIRKPLPQETGFVYSNIPDSVRFELADSANVSLDSIVFKVQDFWNLSVVRPDTVDWLSIEGSTNDSKEGTGGLLRSVRLNMSLNKSMEHDRKATIVLSSGNPTVSTSITIRQFKATKEQYDKMLNQ